MNLLLMFEGIFFSCMYSLTPFVASDILAKPILGYRTLESEEQMTMRYFFVSVIGFFSFYLYTLSGLRTRYMLWHLERERSASGFVPLETAAVGMYHSVVLCLITETILPFVDPLKPDVLSPPWADNVGVRMKNIFLISILQHAFLEMSGFWNKIRKDYLNIIRA